MTAAFIWTERVPCYFRPCLASGVALWRSGKVLSLTQKQEARAFKYHGTRMSFLSLECVRHCHQKSFLTKWSSLSVMKSNLVVSSSTKELNHVMGLHEFVHETSIQTLVSAFNAEKAGEVSVENAEMELEIKTSRIEPIVYTRRSTRKIGAKKILALAESSNNEPMDSGAMAHDPSLQGHSEEASTKELGKTGGKRKAANGVSESIEASEHTELGTNVSSYQKKVGRKTATDTASGSKRRKIIAKTSEFTGSVMNLKIEEINIEPQSVEVAKAKGSEEHNTLIEKVDPWLVLAHKKVQPEWIVYNPLTMRHPKPQGNSMKLLSWNVNGLRALLKGKANVVPGTAFLKLAEKEDFDVLCLQETKLQEKDVVAIQEALLPAYENTLWSCSTAKLGYSGTAVISRIKPLSISYGLGIAKHDSEGRVITVEFDKFFLVTCYVPNSGQKLERLAYRTQDWDLSLANFLKDLEKKKPVILTGDLNCAHQEIDIYNPDGNRRSAGFTDEERTSFEENFLGQGFIDTFRKLHANAVGYTYWGYRTAARPKNHGWRLDYYLASAALLDAVHDSYTLPDVEGSDHCPIGLTLRL